MGGVNFRRCFLSFWGHYSTLNDSQTVPLELQEELISQGFS